MLADVDAAGKGEELAGGRWVVAKVTDLLVGAVVAGEGVREGVEELGVDGVVRRSGNECQQPPMYVQSYAK